MALDFLFRSRLPRELQSWVDDELIEPAQATQILARYHLGSDDQRASLGYMVLMALAILCGGLALLLVISHNWEDLPRALRMLSLLGLTLGLNLAGLRQWAQGRFDSAVRWLFAGGLSYGAAIMLIAQIYHLGEHFPDGLFWWAAGVLPMALLTGSRLLHLLQLSLATLWLLAQSGYGLAWSYPVFVAATAWQLWRVQPSRGLLLLALGGGLIWWQFAFSTWMNERWLWDMDAPHLVAHTAVALVLFTLTLRMAVHANPWWREAGGWLQVGLLRVAMLVLLMFSFSGAWDHFLYHMKEVGAPALLLFLGADLLVLALARQLSPAKLVTLVLVTVVANVIVLGGFLLPDRSSVHLMMAILVNLFLLGCGIRLIVRGLEIRDGQMFYSGVVLLLVLAMMRYLNLIGDYLGSALLFLVAGGILFGAARYWQKTAQRLTQREVAHD